MRILATNWNPHITRQLCVHQIRLENVSESSRPNRGEPKRGLLFSPASLNIQTFPWNFGFEAAQQLEGARLRGCAIPADVGEKKKEAVDDGPNSRL